MKSFRHQAHLFAICAAVASTGALAQNQAPERPHLDAILEKRTFTPGEITALNKDADSAIDVRDLVVFLNGQPTSATFGSAESLIFHSEGSITLPIYFSKPVTGTLKFDLGGNAAFGVAQDYTITPSQRTLTNAVQTQITVHFQPWRGFGGEKSIRLTLNRDPVAVPLNGRFSSHLVRVRQFQQGEFVGMLNFPAGAGLPSLSIRIGLNNSGSAICSFQDANTILGSQIPLSWSGVTGSFPTFNGLATLSLTGNTFGRSTDVEASLAITRMDAPYGDELDAYLEGFPSSDQPALYHAIFTFHNLIAAGQGLAPGSNPFAVVHQGWLAVQPVEYAQPAP